MDPITLALVGGLGLLMLAAKRPPPRQQPPPEQDQGGSSGSGASAGSGGPTLQDGIDAIGAGAAVAGGGWFGQTFADNFLVGYGGGDSTLSNGSGAIIGAGTAGGLYAGVGGVSGALALTGGAILPAVAIIVVPAVVLITVILSYVNIFEQRARKARYIELRDKIKALMKAGKYQEAWDTARNAYVQEGLNGLGFNYGAWAPGVDLSRYFVKDVPLQDGTSIPLADLMTAAYAKSRDTGDQYAKTVIKLMPWLAYFADGNESPDAWKALKWVYDPEFRAELKAQSAAIKAEQMAELLAMKNDGTFDKWLAELKVEARTTNYKTGQEIVGDEP